MVLVQMSKKPDIPIQSTLHEPATDMDCWNNMSTDRKQTLRRMLRRGRRKTPQAAERFTHRFHDSIDRIAVVLNVLAFVADLACLITLVIYAGFEHDSLNHRIVGGLLRGCQLTFGANIIFNYLLRFNATVKDSRIFRWIVDIGVVLTLLPLAYPRPSSPWIPILDTILYSNTFLFSALAAYAVVNLCSGLMRMLSRRTNPTLILSGSFIFFIVTGTFVLMLPKMTLVPLSFTDSLFVSTSAVCITGLTPVDLSQTFTPAGMVAIAVMVQIGGLGVLTFTSFFAIFFSGRPSIYNQLLIRDFIYSKSLSALVPVMLYILSFTLVIELAGAVLIYYTLPDTMDLDTGQKIALSAFHSLSSFCNAGFSPLPDGMSNATLMSGNQNIYITTSVLVIAGGIGFPNLVNFKDVVALQFKKAKKHILHRGPESLPVHIFDLNTKLVLVTTGVLFAAGTLAFFLLERHNTLEGMPLRTQLIQSFFNATTPRSSGFASVSPATFLNVTLVVVLLQMWIGGASQSLAGGIKVNTIAAILLNVRAIVTGQKGVTAFRRNLSWASVRRANAVVTLSVVFLVGYVVTIMLLEPHLGGKEIVFECVSALFTVGSSMGITPELSDSSKIVLSTAMFLGRVGILSLLCGLAGSRPDKSVHYPSDNIIIS